MHSGALCLPLVTASTERTHKTHGRPLYLQFAKNDSIIFLELLDEESSAISTGAGNFLSPPNSRTPPK